MKYIVDLTQQQAEAVQRLLQTGKYPTVAHFISTAVENQIHIENTDEGHAYTCANTATKDTIQFKGHNNFVLSANSRARLTIAQGKPPTVNPPKFSELVASSYDIPENKSWLWGQTNRVLPVKVGLRVLCSFIGNDPWVDLEEFRTMAAEIAAELGTAIRKYEAVKKKKRDDRISAGLPDGGEFKSKHRYMSHFLGYIRKDSLLDGAMPFLRFVNIKREEKGSEFIGLSKGGWQFAKLNNPAIDEQNFERSFSEKEMDFYLDHVFDNVIGESNAITWLLTKLKEGIVERDKLNGEIRQELGDIWKDFSDAVINTQRAGLMARMFELGLIEKTRDGITVRYGISERGEKFLNKNK